jgi:hypothetical protein
MAILITGCVLTAVSWIAAWSRFGLATEFSFFPLWLGYILTLNGVAEVTFGTSLLRRMRRSFAWLFVISIPFWWFFEGLNDIVDNWHYQFPHPVSSTRYVIEASIDFSTVVPAAMSAAFLAAQMFERLGINPAFGIRVTPPGLAISSLLGLLSFSLLGLSPQETFPLVWIAPILIVEPVAYAIGYPSLLRDAQNHGWSVILSVMTGTLFTGFWWELWNYRSLLKWTYTAPHVDFWRLFEMPALGYLGYLFFGVIIFGYAGIMMMLITGERFDDAMRRTAQTAATVDEHRA